MRLSSRAPSLLKTQISVFWSKQEEDGIWRAEEGSQDESIRMRQLYASKERKEEGHMGCATGGEGRSTDEEEQELAVSVSRASCLN